MEPHLIHFIWSSIGLIDTPNILFYHEDYNCYEMVISDKHAVKIASSTLVKVNVTHTNTQFFVIVVREIVYRSLALFLFK